MAFNSELNNKFFQLYRQFNYVSVVIEFLTNAGINCQSEINFLTESSGFTLFHDKVSTKNINETDLLLQHAINTKLYILVTMKMPIDEFADKLDRVISLQSFV